MTQRTLPFLITVVLAPAFLYAQPVAVQQPQGALHGFLSLSSLDGTAIAEGDLEQSSRGGRITSHLIFHFKDGSLQDETTVFTQSGHFRLISDHLIQKGPSFSRQLDLAVNGVTGEATSRYTDHDGKEKSDTVTLKLPPDLANGMVPVLLTNLAAGASLSASMVVAAPKPQVVKLAISSEGEDSFVTGGVRRNATRYLVKIEIGGVKGVIAPLVGKQPPDTRVWILGGKSPAFLKSEGASCEGCPMWRTALASPSWPPPREDTADRKK